MTDGAYFNRYPVTVTTGIVTQQPTIHQQTQKPGETSFADVLNNQYEKEAVKVNFSKHAQNRIADRNIDVGKSNLERLSQGMRLASEKGLDDTLILIDKTAFIVSVKNSMVVTTLNGDDLNGNVFTNIDGTVIV